jgi:hypothetical protein
MYGSLRVTIVPKIQYLYLVAYPRSPLKINYLHLTGLHRARGYDFGTCVGYCGRATALVPALLVLCCNIAICVSNCFCYYRSRFGSINRSTGCSTKPNRQSRIEFPQLQYILIHLPCHCLVLFQHNFSDSCCFPVLPMYILCIDFGVHTF